LPALLILGFYASQIIPWYCAAGADRQSADDVAIRFCFANVFCDNYDYDAFLRQTVNADIDIMVLEEVTQGWLDALAPLRQRLPFEFSRPHDNPAGMAILSRFPLTGMQTENFVSFGAPTLSAIADVDGLPVKIIAAHPAPPLNEHFRQQRNLHIKLLAERLRQEKGPHIVAADMNTTVWTNSYRQFVEITGMIDARQGFGICPTWPTKYSSLLRIPLDYIFHSDDFMTIKFTSLEPFGSDHLAIIAELAHGG